MVRKWFASGWQVVHKPFASVFLASKPMQSINPQMANGPTFRNIGYGSHMKKKRGIWNVCKFSCTVARRDIKFKMFLQNFLYLENKGSNICQLNLDLET